MEKILRTAVIGASGMGCSHMKAVRAHERARLVAICDIDLPKAEKAALEVGNPAVYADYREMLDKEELDAVIIVTPDQLHREMAEYALGKGLHVLCEKPMTLTLEDCRAMVRAADASGKQMMVGQISRYTPGFYKAKEMIDRGEIGELFFVESEYAHNYEKVRGTNDWRVDPLRHGFLGGGCHAVDLLRWIAGNPVETMAYSNHKNLLDWPTDDTVISILKFPNNVMGKVFVSTGCKREYTMRSVFYGTKGTIITDNSNPYMTVFRDSNPDGFTAPERVPIELASHNTFKEFQVFADAVLSGEKVPTDAREGARTVAACLACIESARLGRPVHPEEF